MVRFRPDLCEMLHTPSKKTMTCPAPLMPKVHVPDTPRKVVMMAAQDLFAEVAPSGAADGHCCCRAHVGTSSVSQISSVQVGDARR
jgi:hypothetical protein